MEIVFLDYKHIIIPGDFHPTRGRCLNIIRQRIWSPHSIWIPSLFLFDYFCLLKAPIILELSWLLHMVWLCKMYRISRLFLFFEISVEGENEALFIRAWKSLTSIWILKETRKEIPKMTISLSGVFKQLQLISVSGVFKQLQLKRNGGSFSRHSSFWIVWILIYLNL